MSQDAEKQFMNAVYRADLNKLIALITKEGVDPTAVRDDRGFTALHIAALNDQLRIPTALVQHVKDTSPEYASQLAFWVNQFSNDHFTCLHFAVFRGNKELITLFIEIGADIAATNKQGLSVMHIAAQGDQPLSLALLHYQYGINYLGLDDKRSTALHWAAYLGSDQAAALLLAWDKEKHLIDEQDADGHTALHLAAISGNVKIVRTLLLHGADSKRSDNKGRTPLDIARESKVENIASMLEENRFLTAFGMKPAMREQQKSWGNVVAFVFLLSLGNAYACYFLVPPEHLFLTLGFLGFLYLLIAILVIKDPGSPNFFPVHYLSADKSLLNLYLLNEAHKVCPECIVIQPKRARHCTICRMCVYKYDHHCPWINNCIGARNILLFYVFLLVLWANLALILVGVAYGWMFEFQRLEKGSIWQGVSLAVGMLDVCFLGSLSLLLFVQTRNLMLNRTTHERFAYSSREKSDSVSSQLGDNSGYFVTNCIEMCCSSEVNPDLHPEPQLDSTLDRPLLNSTATS